MPPFPPLLRRQLKEKAKRPAPLCGKCAANHYGFIPCHKAAEQKALADKAAAEFQPVIPQFSRESGVEWAGDRLQTFERHGNTLWRKHTDA